MKDLIKCGEAIFQDLYQPQSQGKGYVVFEDFQKATGPKVHSAVCNYYARWLTHHTTTTTWHGPYETLDEAESKCERIARRTGKTPGKHDCVR